MGLTRQCIATAPKYSRDSNNEALVRARTDRLRYALIAPMRMARNPTNVGGEMRLYIAYIHYTLLILRSTQQKRAMIERRI